MDSFAQTRLTLESFLQDPTPRVIAIKGAWGVGKTYCWNEVMKSRTSIPGCNVVSYASLFGLPGLADIRRTLLVNRKAMPPSRTPFWKKLPWNRVPDLVRDLDLRPVTGGLLQGSKILNEYIEAQALNRILVCLDDLERRETTLSASALLGFIANLRDERKCKVVLLFNEDAPKGKLDDALQEYREKVIDFELTLIPSVKECYDLVFRDRFTFAPIAPALYPFDQVDQRTLLEIFRDAGVANIRVMRRTYDALERFQHKIGKDYRKFWPRFAQHVVKLSIMHFVHGPAFELGEVTDRDKWIALQSLNRKDRKEGKNEAERFQPVFDLQYQPLPVDEIIVRYLTTGHDITGDRLSALDAMELEQVQRERDHEHHRTWDLLWDNFQASQQEFVDKQLAFLKANAATGHIRELGQVVSVLRQVGSYPEAEAILEAAIVKIVQSIDRSQLPTLSLHAVPEEIAKEIARRVNAKKPEKKPIPMVFADMTGRDGWNPSAVENLDGYSAEDFYEWMAAEKSEGFLGRLKIFRQRISAQQTQTKVPELLDAALSKLARRSDFDKLRITVGVGIKSKDERTEATGGN